MCEEGNKVEDKKMEGGRKKEGGRWKGVKGRKKEDRREERGKREKEVGLYSHMKLANARSRGET